MSGGHYTLHVCSRDLSDLKKKFLYIVHGNRMPVVFAFDENQERVGFCTGKVNFDGYVKDNLAVTVS
jgi:hypothetical protein